LVVEVEDLTVVGHFDGLALLACQLGAPPGFERRRPDDNDDVTSLAVFAIPEGWLDQRVRHSTSSFTLSRIWAKARSISSSVAAGLRFGSWSISIDQLSWPRSVGLMRPTICTSGGVVPTFRPMAAHLP